MEQRIGFVTRPDGVRIAYAVVGDGPPLVKIGPWTHLELEWEQPEYRAFYEALARHHTLIRFDKHGTGLSDRDRTTFTLDSDVSDLEVVVDHLRLEGFALFGCSSEGPVTIAYAVRHPERLSHLILYGTFAHGQDVGTPEVREAAVSLVRSDYRLGARVFDDIMAGGDERAEEWNRYSMWGTCATQETTANLFQLTYDTDVRDLLPTLGVPTLVLHREGDRAMPFQAGRELAAQIPRARFVPLEGRTHFEAFGDTEPILRAIAQFLGDLSPEEPDTSPLLRDRYEPLEVVGSGGQGEVVRAHDHQHERHVALKVRPAGAPEHRKSLLSEARILLGLRPHPGLPLVRDDFFVDDRYVVVMDWVEGTDLRTLLDHQGDPGLPVGSVLSYLKDVGEALDHLHSHDPPIVHGDVKPANCILTPQGRVILVDFGIATGEGERRLGSGTRGFVAPEVAAGGRPTPAADVFGLAATAFALLTGSSPEGDWPEFEGVAAATARTLGRAIRLGLSVDPARRPRTAGDLLERLRSWQEASLPTGTVTFLFTDIEGSTPLWDSHPDDMPRVISRHEQLVADAVESSGGRFVKSRGEGDSTVSVFTKATDAVSAAVTMQRSIAAENWPSRIELRVRAALHTGEAQIRDGDYYGGSVNRAARLRGIALGGQAILSDTTAQLVADALPEGVRLFDLGSHELRGLARAERVFQLLAPGMPAVAIVRAARQESDLVGIGLEASSIEAPPWLDPAQRGSLVGREADLQRLRSAWDQARHDGPRLALVTGEPGIGKTRLVGEFAFGIGSDAIILAGQCYEQTTVPFQPFVEALRSYVSSVPTEVLRVDLGRAAPEIAQLVPEVASRLEALPEPSRAGWEAERYAMFDAVAQTLVAISRRAPIVLVLDDLHWADRPTLFLLRHLMRATGASSVLVIGTLRDEEIASAADTAELLSQVRRTDATTTIALTGLSSETVGALLRDRSGSEVPAPVAQAISSETEGNPFFVEEVMRHLAEAGAIDGAGNWRKDLRLRELGLPEGVKEVIGQRLSRLSEPAGRVLAAAAVVGRNFSFDVLERVVDLGANQLLDTLDEATAARVIAELPTAGGFQFTHALVRETLYESLSSARRSVIHRRIGEALEQLDGVAATSHLAALAFHFFEGGRACLDRAVDYGVRAGEAARRQLAYEEAATHLGRALDALNRLEPADPRRSCEILLALGDAQERAGFRAQARKTFLSAADQARELGASEQLAEAALGVAGPGWGELGVVDDVLLDLFEDALAAIGQADGALRVRLLARLAIELPIGDPEHGRGSELSREAVAMARRLRDSQGLAFALVSRLWTKWEPAVARERIGYADEILAIVAETGLLELAREARQARLLSFLELGDVAAADAEIDAESNLAAELRLPLFSATVTQDRAMRALIDGRFDEAEALTLQSLTEGGEDANVVVAFGAQLLLLRWEQGRLHEMVEPLREFANEYPGLPSFRCALAAVCAELGMLDASRREVALIVSVGLSSLPRDTLPLSLSLLTLACDPLEDSTTAAELYELLEPYAQELMMIRSAGTLGPAHRYLGVLAALQANWSVAEHHFEQALKGCARIGSPPWNARAQYDFARMLLRRDAPGDRGRATELAAQASSVARGMGMSALAAKAAMLLDRATVKEETVAPGEPRANDPGSWTDLLRDRYEPQEAVASPAPSGNLPRERTTFIGRTSELGNVRENVLAHRLVTLTGPGGSGKTRLALRAAAETGTRFRDGVWFVDLSSIADATVVPQTIASALDVRDMTRSPTHAVIARLSSGSALVLIDNCEHVLDASARLVDAVLEGCPNVHVLATSREPLALEGEATIAIPPMALPSDATDLASSDAGRLFAERASAAQPEFALTAETAAVVDRICRHLDGLPLAIELAAARLHTLSITDLDRRLDTSFRLLSTDKRSSPSRQRTLEAAITWSYDLLNPPEQTLLRRLSVFAGGFTLDATEAVCAEGSMESDDIPTLLSGLVDRSLVVAEHAGAAARYRLLEMIRSFAEQRLDATDEAPDVRRKHLRYCTALAEEASPRLFGPDQRRWMAVLDAEHDNVQRALEWAQDADLEGGFRLIAAMLTYWAQLGDRRDGLRWLDWLEAAKDEAPVDLRIKAVNGMSHLLGHVGHWDTIDRISTENLETARAAGDARGAATAMRVLGQLALNRAEYGRARSLLEEAVETFRAAGDRSGGAFTKLTLATVIATTGDLGEARSMCEEALRICEELGDDHFVENAIRGLGAIDLESGDLAGARSHFEHGLVMARDVGCRLCEANFLSFMAELKRREGDRTGAAACFIPALTTWREQGGLPFIVGGLEAIGVMALEDDPAAATRLIASASALREALRFPRHTMIGSGHFLKTILDDDAKEARFADQAREALGEQTYRRAADEGHRLPLEKALDLAMEVAVRLAPQPAASRNAGDSGPTVDAPTRSQTSGPSGSRS